MTESTIQSLLERPISVGPEDFEKEVTPNSNVSSCIRCEHFEPFTPSKAVSMLFLDIESPHPDSPCDDDSFLRLVKQRRRLMQPISPKSNCSNISTNLSGLSDPEVGMSQCSGASGDYPSIAGLKWRQSRGRSAASAVSSLSCSSISSDGQSAYRSTRDIILSRKFQFADIDKLRETLSPFDEKKTNAIHGVGIEASAGYLALNEVDTPPTTPPPIATTKDGGKAWTPERSKALLKIKPNAVNPIIAGIQLAKQEKAKQGDKQHNDDIMALQRTQQELSESPERKKSHFSFKKLIPKFIRKRRFSAPSLPFISAVHGEEKRAGNHQEEMAHNSPPDNQSSGTGPRQGSFLRRGTM